MKSKEVFSFDFNHKLSSKYVKLIKSSVISLLRHIYFLISCRDFAFLYREHVKIKLDMSCCDDGDCHEKKNEEHEHHHDEACNHPHEEAIQQLSEEEQLRLKKQRIERRRQANQQNKKKYQPLLKFLKKNGLKFKTAGAEKNSVEYFRMDHFKAFLKEKKELINSNANVRQLLHHWQEIFIYYDRLENQPHFKWPQQLAPSKKGTNSKFASFSFDSTESSKWKASLVLLAVIGVVLFPLWPFELKYYLWLLSYYTFVALAGTIILRWIVYMFCSIFGASIWIFPRLFDNVEMLQSFTPFLSVNRWEGSTIYSVVTRILIFSIFAYYGYHIYVDPSIVKQNIGITKTIMDDLNDWGISKIKGEKNFSQSALTDYSKLLNSTQEENDDQKIVGFTSIHEEQF